MGLRGKSLSSHPSQPALLLIVHGTREALGQAEHRGLVRRVRRALPGVRVALARLAPGGPPLSKVAQKLLRDGVPSVLVVPVLLLPGTHVVRDIPRALRKLGPARGRTRFILSPPIGAGRDLLQLVTGSCSHPSARGARTVILLPAHGSTQRGTTAAAGRLARALQGRISPTVVRACFIVRGRPSLTQALDCALRENAPSIRVVPLILFRGRLLGAIRRACRTYSSRNRAVSIRMSPPLASSPELVRIVANRWVRCTGRSALGSARISAPTQP
ncbi:MAG: hypothetical protein HYY13_07305 [Nitrospirae bacterium]|nr:hypothetical protein [Nitrospirota bacterium]